MRISVKERFETFTVLINKIAAISVKLKTEKCQSIILEVLIFHAYITYICGEG